MTGSNRRPLACKANALPAELIAHKYIDFKTASVLSPIYPQRLDALKIELVCVATLYYPLQGRFLSLFIYVFTLHQSALQPSVAVRPIVRKWYIRIVYLIIGVILYM